MKKTLAITGVLSVLVTGGVLAQGGGLAGLSGVAGGDLRDEALQYTAISFADDKWGSLAKAQEYFAKKIEERRQSPQNDMLSDLSSRMEGEDPFSVEEVLNIIEQVLEGKDNVTAETFAARV